MFIVDICLGFCFMYVNSLFCPAHSCINSCFIIAELQIPRTREHVFLAQCDAHALSTLGVDEAKMYNCLIFRGRVRPNARLTASMHVNARENRHAAGMSTHQHILSISQTSASSDQTRKRKEKKGFALHLLSVCRKSML